MQLAQIIDPAFVQKLHEIKVSPSKAKRNAAMLKRKAKLRQEMKAAEHARQAAAQQAAEQARVAAAEKATEEQSAAVTQVKAPTPVSEEFKPKIVHLPSEEEQEAVRAQNIHAKMQRTKVELLIKWKKVRPTTAQFLQWVIDAGFVHDRDVDRNAVYICEGVEIVVFKAAISVVEKAEVEPTPEEQAEKAEYRRLQARYSRQNLLNQRRESRPTTAQFLQWVIGAGFVHDRDVDGNAVYVCEGVEIVVFNAAVTVAPEKKRACLLMKPVLTPEEQAKQKAENIRIAAEQKAVKEAKQAKFRDGRKATSAAKQAPKQVKQKGGKKGRKSQEDA